MCRIKCGQDGTSDIFVTRGPLGNGVGLEGTSITQRQWVCWGLTSITANHNSTCAFQSTALRVTYLQFGNAASAETRSTSL